MQGLSWGLESQHFSKDLVLKSTLQLQTPPPWSGDRQTTAVCYKITNNIVQAANKSKRRCYCFYTLGWYARSSSMNTYSHWGRDDRVNKLPWTDVLSISMIRNLLKGTSAASSPLWDFGPQTGLKPSRLSYHHWIEFHSLQSAALLEVAIAAHERN